MVLSLKTLLSLSLLPLLLFLLFFFLLIIILYFFVITSYIHCCYSSQVNITIIVSIISFINFLIYTFGFDLRISAFQVFFNQQFFFVH